MIKQFSLYGFLKNQRYFETFLMLIFLEKGLSFFQIGILIGFREICINLFEVPSGAAADLYGRRRAMIFSFLCYIASFVIFALSRTYFLFFIAMFTFAMGEVFRTGTHKAMIFDWLKHEGRINEKTKVYGYTRSWSKNGSALSVLIAAGLVFYTGSYVNIFWFSIPPYLMAVISFIYYPKYLDGIKKVEFSLRTILKHFIDAIKLSWHKKPVRQLMVESMGFEGLYGALKDYLQPILKQAALALPFFLLYEQEKRSAILIGIVYFVLHFLSGIASRYTHKISEFYHSEIKAARLFWFCYLAIFTVLIPSFMFNFYPFMILGFVILDIMQNLWRPVLISRFDDHAPDEMGATILSIESQAQSAATMVLAPSFGLLVDHFGFTPIAVTGFLISGSIIFRYYRKNTWVDNALSER